MRYLLMIGLLLRVPLLSLVFAVNAFAAAEHPEYAVDEYYALLQSSPSPTGGASGNSRMLWKFLRVAWPDQGDLGYVPTSFVRTPAERLAFLQALRRLVQDKLAAAGNPPPGSAGFRQATYSLFLPALFQQPLAYRALLLSMDGELDEADIWQLIALRIESKSRRELFADIRYLFGEGDTLWTPEARAVFDLANQGTPTYLGLQRLFARYQEEVLPSPDSGQDQDRLRLALPIRGLYAEPVEHLLALVEGRHLWRARDRGDLAGEALIEARLLAASLSSQLGRDLSPVVEEALAAPVIYVPALQELPAAVYWPAEGEQVAGDGSVGQTPPATLRWVRSGAGGEIPGESANIRVTRRVGSNDVRWWPAFQEAYLDLAYRGLPELLRQRVAAEGQLEVFRVWHAGSEDGSQTFLLATLLDEAVELLLSDPRHRDIADELRALRIEIFATDYAYMPDRVGLTYRFDATGQIGNIHHKWNLIAEESAATCPSVVTSSRVNQGACEDPARLRKLIAERIRSAADSEERARILRTLANEGWATVLLGRFLEFAPAVDVPTGAWLQDHPGGAAKHRFRLVDDRWRIVELHEAASSELVSPGTPGRLIRFEMGDMAQELPAGFDGGDAFDLSVVTNVLPYIYAYYAQEGRRSLQSGESDGVLKVRLTPMEEAQNKLIEGSRPGAWILLDIYTELDALAAGDEYQPFDPNYKNWTQSWIEWLRALPEKQLELYLTTEQGVKATGV